jgi:hypothetical protein
MRIIQIVSYYPPCVGGMQNVARECLCQYFGGSFLGEKISSGFG